MQVLEKEPLEKVETFSKTDWGLIVERGMVRWISPVKHSQNGNFYIVKIIDESNQEKFIQAWDEAYSQLASGEVIIGQQIEAQCWPSYYKQDGKSRISFKTNKFLPLSSKIFIRATITSEWRKAESEGKDYWMFSAKPITGEGLVMECKMLKSNLSMRELKKGNTVDIIGNYVMERSDEWDKLKIEVYKMDVV